MQAGELPDDFWEDVVRELFNNWSDGVRTVDLKTLVQVSSLLAA